MAFSFGTAPPQQRATTGPFSNPFFAPPQSAWHNLDTTRQTKAFNRAFDALNVNLVTLPGSTSQLGVVEQSMYDELKTLISLRTFRRLLAKEMDVKFSPEPITWKSVMPESKKKIQRKFGVSGGIQKTRSSKQKDGVRKYWEFYRANRARVVDDFFNLHERQPTNAELKKMISDLRAGRGHYAPQDEPKKNNPMSFRITGMSFVPLSDFATPPPMIDETESEEGEVQDVGNRYWDLVEDEGF